MSRMNETPIPALRKDSFLGSFSPLPKDRIGMLRRMRQDHGAVVSVRTFGFLRAIFLTEPDLAHQVLVEEDDAFVKGFGLSFFGRPLLGNGLLTSEHEVHKRQRRMMSPAFAHKRIAEYATVIGQRAESTLAGWRDGAAIDLSAEMMKFTLEVVGKTLFDAEVGSEAAEIGRAITEAMEFVIKRVSGSLPIPPSWPTPVNRRNKRAIARLDETIYRIIRERRADKVDRGDFLSMLLMAQDEDNGTGMTDKQVRDEAMTIFLAGHETTANALAWAFHLLARNPEARARLEREVDTALGGRTPTLADLAQMPYALAVFKETMRLYPPVYMVVRRAERAVTLGTYSIRKNDLVLVNIYGMHRLPEAFPDPDRFDPERFLPENEKRLPRNVFVPFSAGPRVCIGNHFALMEGQLALAAFTQRARLEPVQPGRTVEMEPLITLRPKGGMPMRVTRREVESAKAEPPAARSQEAHAAP
jgi:cytochrome P450